MGKRLVFLVLLFGFMGNEAQARRVAVASVPEPRFNSEPEVVAVAASIDPEAKASRVQLKEYLQRPAPDQEWWLKSLRGATPAALESHLARIEKAIDELSQDARPLPLLDQYRLRLELFDGKRCRAVSNRVPQRRVAVGLCFVSLDGIPAIPDDVYVEELARYAPAWQSIVVASVEVPDRVMGILVMYELEKAAYLNLHRGLPRPVVPADGEAQILGRELRRVDQLTNGALMAALDQIIDRIAVTNSVRSVVANITADDLEQIATLLGCTDCTSAVRPVVGPRIIMYTGLRWFQRQQLQADERMASQDGFLAWVQDEVLATQLEE